MPLALDDLRMIDCTENLAGPYCSLLLADMGVEVIKIERRDTGDNIRGQMPQVNGYSLPFSMVNRNKKSVTVNLKDPRGKEIVRKLAKVSDIFLENYRPGTMSDLELDYERLRKINPALIYCSVSGFGQTGPYSDRGGLDLIAQAMGGLMSVTGEPDGIPCKAGYPVTDLGTGMFATYGVLTALHYRSRTGYGQLVDTSLLETAVAWSVWHAAKYFGTGEVPGPQGSGHPISVPYQAFKTQDVYVIVGAASQALFQRLCKVLNTPELVDDSRFSTQVARVEHREALIEILQERFMTKRADEWIEALMAEGIPCGPINPMDRVFSDPHILHRQMKIEMEHPVAGKINSVGNSVKLSETPMQVRFPAPSLGQHTDEILQFLGYSTDEISSLRQEKAI